MSLIETAKKYIGTHHDYSGDLLIASWLKNVGLDLKDENGKYYAYCSAFVYSVCKEYGIADRIPKTASALNMWNKCDPIYKTSIARPNSIFVWDFGKGSGHVGFVDAVKADRMDTIEGNTTNPAVPNNR